MWKDAPQLEHTRLPTILPTINSSGTFKEITLSKEIFISFIKDFNASACGKVLGKPSKIKPDLQSSSANLSLIIPMIVNQEQVCPHP